MGLIDKYANIYFLVARRLIEFANLHGGITEKQIRSISDKYGVLDDNTDFVNAIMGRSDANNKFNGIWLFDYDESRRKYKVIVKNLPIVLNSIEWKSLCEALTTIHSGVFLRCVTAEKLGVEQQADDTTVCKMRQCVTAIQQDKWIYFDNITADGIERKNQHLKPQKIEISAETNENFVSGYSRESRRLIKCNLDRMTIHEVIDGEDIDIESLLDEKRLDNPIRLQIENSKGATDRAFNMFSGFEKEGFYDKQTGNYILNIYYYQFEERTLIEKLLGLGAAAIVISPSNIVEIIKERIRQQLARLT